MGFSRCLASANSDCHCPIHRHFLPSLFLWAPVNKTWETGKNHCKTAHTLLVCIWAQEEGMEKKIYRSMSTVRRSEKAWDASLDIFLRAMSKWIVSELWSQKAADPTLCCFFQKIYMNIFKIKTFLPYQIFQNILLHVFFSVSWPSPLYVFEYSLVFSPRNVLFTPWSGDQMKPSPCRPWGGFSFSAHLA